MATCDTGRQTVSELVRVWATLSHSLSQLGDNIDETGKIELVKGVHMVIGHTVRTSPIRIHRYSYECLIIYVML